MKKVLALTALIGLAIGASGCAQLFGSDANFQAALKDIQGCKRHYTGQIGAGAGAGGGASFEITCEPQQVAPPAPAS